MKERSSIFGHLFALVTAALLAVVLAFLVAKSVQSLTLTASNDDLLLKGFEVFLALLVLGTLALVLLGVVLRTVLPRIYGTKPFAENRLREIYENLNCAHISVESDRNHATNPYRDLPDLELCDVAVQVDQDKYPEVWLDMAHEIKNRVEQDAPMRIG